MPNLKQVKDSWDRNHRIFDKEKYFIWVWGERVKC